MTTLRHPVNTPTTIIQLPNPDRGNSNILERPLRIKRAMDGTTYSYAFGQYLNNLGYRKKLNMSFRNLTGIQRSQIITFFDIAGKDEITVIDHLGTTWTVKIFTSNLTFREDANCERYSTTLEFVGQEA